MRKIDIIALSKFKDFINNFMIIANFILKIIKNEKGDGWRVT